MAVRPVPSGAPDKSESRAAAGDGPSTVSTPRRRGPFRRLGLWLLLCWVAVAGSTLLILALADDHEQTMIELERWQRRTLVGLGFSLPGTPDLANLEGRLASSGLSLGAPVFLRIFKREFELELWMQRDGKFHLFATYPICLWSGRLGPKLRTGDRQAPEGVYTIDRQALNAESRWHRSFNLGFPNAYDRAHGRTGSFLMVHGGCSSIGCFAMTNPVIEEIWRLVTAALDRGQARIQVQVLPFRMTQANLERHGAHPDIALWRELERGSRLFEEDLVPPLVRVCGGRYLFERAPPGSDGGRTISPRCRFMRGTRSTH